jgi:hypothetical protein
LQFPPPSLLVVVPAQAGTYFSGGKAALKEAEAPERARLDRGLFGVGPGFRRDDDFGDAGATNGMHWGTARGGKFLALGTP